MRMTITPRHTLSHNVRYLRMLAIQRPRLGEDKCVPNILPCKINHTGPSKVTKRFWRPTTEQDGSRTSYFRGRKLRGRAINLPPNYQGALFAYLDAARFNDVKGVIWNLTDKLMPQQPTRRPPTTYDDDSASDEEDAGNVEEVKIIDQVSTFDNMLVWGHDQLPSESDAFVKSVDEWIQFAEAIHKPATSESSTT